MALPSHLSVAGHQSWIGMSYPLLAGHRPNQPHVSWAFPPSSICCWRAGVLSWVGGGPGPGSWLNLVSEVLKVHLLPQLPLGPWALLPGVSSG